MNPRVQSVSFSVLPLGRQILKLTLYLVAVLGVFSAWGYNTSTIHRRAWVWADWRWRWRRRRQSRICLGGFQ